MARGQIPDEQRIFRYGVGAIRTVLIHSENVIHYHLERLNELGQWSMIVERYFSPEQFASFIIRLEEEIPRIVSCSDGIRDSIHVSVILAGDDIQKDTEPTESEDNR